MKDCNPTRRSLYGREEPCVSYRKYVGKPLYKASRRLGLSDYLSLAVANAPGSFVHASPFFVFGLFEAGAAAFVISEVIMTNNLYSRHQAFQRERALRVSEKRIPERPRKKIEEIVERMYS
ncbi:hypothetical protein JW711_01765 [Candidatus Woesearchaeota archaeon]|nr:hypothetical protein [Candidatus Woesearchaeota archaeon]